MSATLTVGLALVHALATDLSPGGIRFVSERPVDVGATVEVAFLLDGEMICGRGEVSWCAPTQRGLAAFGMVFTMLEDDGAEAIASFVTEA